jgi:predicted RND superfamily exporter protein
MSSIGAVRLFTLWTAIGVLLAFALMIVLMPIALQALPMPSRQMRNGYMQLPAKHVIAGLHRFSCRPQLATPLIAMILMAAFAWGGMQLDVRTDVTQLMPPDLPSMQTLQLIRDDGQGAANLDVVVSVPDKSFRDDGQLSLLYELENELVNRFNEIDSVRSITRVIEGLYSRDGHSGFPGESADLDEYLLFVELTADEGWLRRFVGDDFESVRFSLRLEHVDSRSTIESIQRIEDWLRDHAPATWSVSTSGALKLLVINIQALVESQLKSFFVALLVITCVVFLFIRDRQLSGASLLVNLGPVLLTMGFFPLLALVGLAGTDSVSLNVSTIMVPSVAMALAVDDTIHFLAYYREARSNGANTDTAIGSALHGAGFAMLITTFTMILGFGVLLFSRIPANQEFAAMLSIALFAALVSDLVLLPHLVRRWARKSAA